MFVLKMAHNNKTIIQCKFKFENGCFMVTPTCTSILKLTFTLFIQWHFSRITVNSLLRDTLYKTDTLLALTPPVGPSFFAPFSWLSMDGQIEPVPKASVLQRIDCNKLQFSLEYYNSEDCSNRTKKLVTLFTALWCSFTSKSQKCERMLVNWN